MALFNANRTISIAGACLPASPYGTPFLYLSSIEGTNIMGTEMYSYSLELKAKDEYSNPAHGWSGMEGFISKATADAGGAVGSNWSLKSVIGQQVCVQIELDGKVTILGAANNGFGVDIERAAGGLLNAAQGAGKRYISGLVTKAAYVGVKNNYATYHLDIAPKQYVLTKTTDYRIFQNISIPEMMREILNQFACPYEFRLSNTYESKDFTVIYGQTYWDFICYHAQDLGIYWFWEMGNDSHKMIICDSLGAHKPLPSVAYHDLYVYPKDVGKLQEEYIYDFAPAQHLVSGKSYLKDFQFKRPTADESVTAQQPWDTAHNQLEVYEWHQGNYIDAETGGQDKARLRAEELRQHGHRAQGAGNVRGIETGYVFNLKNHSHEDSNRQWLIVSSYFKATEIGQETSGNAPSQFTIESRFVVQPSNEIFRPDRTTQKPKVPSQTATVTTPEGKEVWTDAYGRVKCRFHWDRFGTSDENSSCWLRVSTPWQGTNFGGVHLPRKGQEVIVSFLNNDSDMPYISGRFSNPDNMPLYELPSQHALSGFKSKEIDGGQNNALIMDDTPQQIQVMLSSDHSLSQLNLGYVTRIPNPSGRADYRGQGFEARTDDWGVLRSGKGMLITTYLRANGASHIKDMSETIGILRGAHSQHKSFAELAIDHKADERALNDTAHTQIQTQNEQVAGHEGKGDKFPELVEPHLVLTSPAGIEAATPKSLHIATDEHTAITTGQDLSLSVGKRLAASVAKGISLFTHSLGIKLFAAKGKVEIQAQSDNIDIIADKVMKLISAKESIHLVAKKEVLITAGTSYIKINAGGIEHGTLGNWKAWAGSHAMVGPKSLPFRSPDMKPKSFIELNYHWPDDLEPVKFAPYEVKFKGGAIYKGKLDEKGYARIDNTPDEEWEVWFGEDGRGIPEA